MDTRAGCVPLTDAQRGEAERYLGLCERAARRFSGRYRFVARGEFLSAAFDGLVDALRRHDDSTGVPLERYAPRRIAGACVDMMRRDSGGAGGAIRVTRAGHAAGIAPSTVSIDRGRSGAAYGSERTFGVEAAGGPTFADFLLPPAKTPPPDAAMAAREGFEALVAGLDATSQFIVRKTYGPSGWNLREIADHLGLSPSRVGQIHAAALERVRVRAFGLGLAPAAEVAREASRPAPPPPEAKPAPGWRDRRGAWRTPPPLPFDAAELPAYLGGLGPIERRVVEMRYGLGGAGPRTPAEIAAELGRKRNWAWVVLKRALARVGAMHEEKGKERQERIHE